MDTVSSKRRFGQDLMVLRWGRLRISQDAFAETFGLTLGTVQNAEQERYAPNPALRVLVAAIDLDPAFMEKAAKVSRERWG